MNKKYVVILHDEIHPLLQRISERLEALSCKVVWKKWDSLSYDTISSISFENDCVVYLDRLGENSRSYSTQIDILEAIQSHCSDIKIFNSPSAYWKARNKALSFLECKKFHLPIPATAVAYSKEHIDSFCRKVKSSYYIAKSYLGCCCEEVIPFGREIGYPENIDKIIHRDGLIVVQNFINNPKRYIWRIDIVNNQVIQCNQRFSYTDTTQLPMCNGTVGGEIIIWDPLELPIPVKSLALKAVQAFNLVVAGVDILVDESNSLFIAEINPEPDITLGATFFPFQIAEFLANQYTE